VRALPTGVRFAMASVVDEAKAKSEQAKYASSPKEFAFWREGNPSRCRDCGGWRCLVGVCGRVLIG